MIARRTAFAPNGFRLVLAVAVPFSSATLPTPVFGVRIGWGAF